MTRFKISTLSLALLGGLALAGCDNNVDTAATDTYTPDTTAATEPVDTTTPDMNDPAATGEYDTADPATMGDVNDPNWEGQDPTMTPEPEPMDEEYNDLDPADPVDETPTPQ